RYSANMSARLNRADNAEPSYRQALQLLDALVVERPGERFYQDQLAETLRDHADLLEQVGRYGDAGSALRRSLEIGERLRSTYPERGGYRHTLATSLLELSGIEYSQGRFTESSESGRQAADLFFGLVEASQGPAAGQAALLLGMSWNR